MKGSLPDSKVDWPLVPGDASTTLLNLINELRGAGVDYRMLVNQFLQFDSPTFDDFPELVPIIFTALRLTHAAAGLCSHADRSCRLTWWA